MNKTAIIIPSRLEAIRLPNKPMELINNKEMILHVYEAAKKADIGEVIVASPNEEIRKLITSHNGVCVITKPSHKTGTDRIFEVFDKFLKRKPKIIINLQGDMPNIETESIKYLSNYMKKNLCDVATLASNFKNKNEINNLNNVKVLTKEPLTNEKFCSAIDFFRSYDDSKVENIYHHIGIYAFTKEALVRYVSLEQTKKELNRNLEQLRALDANMKIHVGYTSSAPLSVDTEEDLENIQKIMK